MKMKRLISVLLAVIMAFSTMPIIALADNVVDNVVIDSDEIFESSIDYSAYDSIVKLVEALDEKEYTKDSIDNVKSKVVSKDTLTTQEEIDNAVKDIAIAYAELEKNSFKVSFIVIDSQENEKIESYTYYYGDTASLSVDNGEVPYKWIASSNKGDKVVGNNENDLSLIVNENCTILAYTDVKPEEKHQLQKVTFLSFNGKPIHIEYTEDVYNVEMPEAPTLPFYYFSEWIKLNDNTYQASYLSDMVCDGTHHRFTTMVAKAGCESVGYVIFQCSCGEAFSTDYTRPTGHNFDSVSKYCLNGCGKLNPNIEDESDSSEEGVTNPSEPTTEPSSTEDGYSIGNDGYNSIVIAP